MPPPDWSFGDEPSLPPLFVPGRPRCRHCSTSAPEGIPDSYARCQVCGYHLHTCGNCMFYTGLACLLLEPAFWADSGARGLFCKSFAWREDEFREGDTGVDTGTSAQDVSSAR